MKPSFALSELDKKQAGESVSFLLRLLAPLARFFPKTNGPRDNALPFWLGFGISGGCVLLTVLGIEVIFNARMRNLIFPEYFILLILVTNEFAWLFGRSQSEKQDTAEKRIQFSDVSSLGRFFTYAILFGFYLLIRLGWTHKNDHFRVLFTITIWGLAALSCGGLLGFLFGIPRTLSGSAADRQAEAQRTSIEGVPTYRVNTNLERVSDWLTQIIVGGTVTQLALLPGYWRRMGDYYGSTVAGGSAPGPQNSLWALAGAGSTAYFLVTGFLGSYLITRLYLAGAIQRADGTEEPKVKRLSNLTTAELEALEAAPLQYDDNRSDFDPQAQAAADKILKLSPDQLSNWRDLRVWAKAQLGAGDAQKAIAGYMKCLETMPDDTEVRLGYAIALGAVGGATPTTRLSGSQRFLVQTQLEMARECLRLNSPGPLRKNVYKSLIYSVLFLKAPESFRKALCYAREYYSRSGATESAEMLFNIACAFGQAHAWLLADTTRRLTISELEYNRVTQDESQAENNKALSLARSSALGCLRLAIERTDSLRKKLAEMINKTQETNDVDVDDDLYSFASDPEFRILAGLAD